MDGRFCDRPREPFVVLKMSESKYFDAASRCHEALSNHQQILEAADQFHRSTLLALRRSAMVGMMDCYEKESLRQLVLSRGVSEHDLTQLDLRTRNGSPDRATLFREWSHEKCRCNIVMLARSFANI
jgi:hypothetical protein